MGYRAFFSYARADDKVANWLHDQLDSYRTPRALVGADGALGPVPAKLHPIFRDRTDLQAGGHIETSLQQALEGSDTLVVLCSPTSAKSHWVNHECETFLSLGREARIFPVIAAGEPDSGDPESECFPPALRGRGLLAADLREIKTTSGRRIGDGRDVGRLKLIAGLLGISLDQLIQRERRRQRGLVAVLAGAAALFAAVAVAAVLQTITAQRNLAAAERAAAIGLAQQSAQAILDGNLPRGFAIAADAVDQYPAHKDRFLTQLRWIAFATREYVGLHQRRAAIVGASASPDERYIASIDAASTLAVTDLETRRTWAAPGVEGMQFAGVSVGNDAVGVAFSAYDQNHYGPTRGHIQIRRLSDGSLISSFDAGSMADQEDDGALELIGIQVGGFALSPNGQRVAICDGSMVSMYDARGRVLWRSDYFGFSAAPAYYGACMFDDGGARLAVGMRGAVFLLFDASNGTVLMRRSEYEDETGPNIDGPYATPRRSGGGGWDDDWPSFLRDCTTLRYRSEDRLERFYAQLRDSENGVGEELTPPGQELRIAEDDYVVFWPRAQQACGRLDEERNRASDEAEEGRQRDGELVSAGDVRIEATSATRLSVRMPGSQDPIVVRTRGDISYAVISADGSLLLVNTHAGGEVWDGRYGLLVARINELGCGESRCNRLGPFTEGGITFRADADDIAYFKFESPEFSEGLDELISVLCLRLFAAALEVADRPHACGAAPEVTVAEP